ncbi:MAG: SPFH domain / Band 7 family protein [Parcubacteria group bacterium ADurb.Bin115]|nr:MAG: SPFH domain / Band 7 family protein [Parcubacteria group bacterium ADurb.Bin115]
MKKLIAVLVLAIIIVVAIIFEPKIILVLAIFLVLVMKLFSVPENWEYQISFLGKYWKTCGPGLGWRVRWLSKVDHEVFMGDQTMRLALGDPSGLGGGVVDFQDGSAPITAFFFFKIFDSYKAAYSTADILRMIEEQADGTIRSFLSLFNIEDANTLKNNFNLGWIAAMTIPVPGGNPPPLEQTHLWMMLNAWGVRPLNFTVTDIAIPSAIIEQRQRKQRAATDIDVATLEIEIAKKQAEKVVIDAEANRKAKVLAATGEAEGMDKISKAMAQRIRELMDKNGMTEEAARAHVISLAKAEALKEAKNVIWSEGNSAAGQGAAFGSGFNAVNSANQSTPNQ